MKYFATIFFCLFNLICFTQNTVCINNSEIKKITSKSINGQEFELQILLPNGFSSSTKTYPTVYVLDAQWDFPLVSGIYGQNYYDGQLPELLIVGITWSGSSPNYDSLRIRDFTPAKNDANFGGEAEAFQTFLRDELFPYLEKNYRAENHNRTILGSSLGGLFTMYTLFTKPEMFTNYIAASPAIGWANNSISQFEELFYLNDQKGPKKLYVTTGELEPNANQIAQYAKFIEEKKYHTLRPKFKMLEKTGHAGSKTETYYKGLLYAYERPDMHVHEAILEKYLGKYFNSKKAMVELIKENHGLTLIEGGIKYPLNATSETEFYSNAKFLNISFFTNELVGFKMDVFGRSYLFKK